MNRKGDWMETFTGRRFWPVDPRPEEMYIEDIAHALSQMCRFNGHCRQFYSVAEHSVHCTELVKEASGGDSLSMRAALLHDASEAYLSDIIRPVKRSLQTSELKEIESRLDVCVAERFGVACPMLPVVKWADDGMLKNEHEQLFTGIKSWECDGVDVRRVHISLWTPLEAEAEFLRVYEELKCR